MEKPAQKPKELTKLLNIMLVDRGMLPKKGKLAIPQEQVSTSPMDETLEMTLKRCWALERLNHVANVDSLVNFKERNRHDLLEIRLCFRRAGIWEAAPNMHLANKESCVEFSKGLSECGKRHKLYQICLHFFLPTLCRGDATWKETHHISLASTALHLDRGWPVEWRIILKSYFALLNHNWRSRCSPPPHSLQTSQRT